MTKRIFILLFIALNILNAQCKDPLRIHSHNDYKNESPLYNALRYCAKSIEVDIHLVNGKILVGHDLGETKETETLESLYLQPLMKIFEVGQSEFNVDYEIYLLIDIKSDADSTFTVLNKLLQNYEKLLTYYQDGVVHKRKIKVILSGNRPIDIVSGMEMRIVFIDGRLTDINKNYSHGLFPLISDSQTKVAEYLGYSDFEFIDHEEFTDLVAEIHKENKCFRIWGVPDNEEYWKLQLDYGVDLVNTDKSNKLSEFIRKCSKKK